VTLIVQTWSNIIEGADSMPREYLIDSRPNRKPTHPGKMLREDVLPALGISVSEAARRMRISRQSLHRILAGDAGVTPDMAVRLGKFCGNGPGLWLRMQQAYDLWHAEQRLASELAKIPTASVAA
jgi:addiction module HigA family antidote